MGAGAGVTVIVKALEEVPSHRLQDSAELM
jgi:hypothetical protein